MKKAKLLSALIIIIFFLSDCGGGTGNVGTIQIKPTPVNNVSSGESGVTLVIHWPGGGSNNSKNIHASLIQPSVSYIVLNLYSLVNITRPSDWIDHVIMRPSDPNSTGVSSLFFPTPPNTTIIVDAAGYSAGGTLLCHREQTVNVLDGPTLGSLELGVSIYDNSGYNGPTLYPDSMTGSVGDEILWINESHGSYIIVIENPSGTQLGTSVLLKPQDSWSFQGFSAAGSYTCKINDSGGGTLLTRQIVISASIPPLPDMVLIKGGTYTMGKTGVADPNHQVTVSDFYMDKYELTNEEYVRFLNDQTGNVDSLIWVDSGDPGSNSSRGLYVIAPNPPSGIKVKVNYSRRPVIDVTWTGAVEYCNWLSVKHGFTPCYTTDGNYNLVSGANGYRLPTEAEWEYACRAGTTTDFYWGQTYTDPNMSPGLIDNYCWYQYNSGGNHHTVGTRQPNSYGLYDMAGNVWEWCHDRYDVYSSLPQINPTGPGSGSDRILRGDGWDHDAGNCRSALRSYHVPTFRDAGLGFRPVRSVQGSGVDVIILKK